MIASRENSFPSEPFSRGDHCLPRAVELETASSAGISVRIAELRRMAFLLALSPAHGRLAGGGERPLHRICMRQDRLILTICSMRIGVGLQPTGLTHGKAPGGGPILQVGISCHVRIRLPATSDRQFSSRAASQRER